MLELNLNFKQVVRLKNRGEDPKFSSDPDPAQLGKKSDPALFKFEKQKFIYKEVRHNILFYIPSF